MERLLLSSSRLLWWLGGFWRWHLFRSARVLGHLIWIQMFCWRWALWQEAATGLLSAGRSASTLLQWQNTPSIQHAGGQRATQHFTAVLHNVAMAIGILNTILPCPRSFDIFIGCLVQSHEESVKSSQSHDGPQGEEANENF